MPKINYQIKEYLEYCEKICQMSPNTLVNKCAILRKFAREAKINSLENLTNRVYDFYLKNLFNSGTSTSSINIYSSTVISLVKFHNNNGLKIPLNLNLIPHFKTSKTVRRFYTKADIEKVLTVADRTEALMIRIMFETGMRIAEIVSLRADNLSGNKITFIGKGSKLRVVYLTQETCDLLQEYLKKYNTYDGYVWCIVRGVKTKTAEPPTAATVRKNLQDVFRRAGFEGFYPHALRHSFATNLQKHGARVEEIKEMMGHSSIATTERYLHGFDGRLEELFNKYR